MWLLVKRMTSVTAFESLSLRTLTTQTLLVLLNYLLPRTTGGYVFTGVCLLTRRGWYPSLWSHVPSQPLVPCPLWGRYPSLWSHVLSWGVWYSSPVTCPAGGYPGPVTGPARGYPSTGVPPSCWDWGTPSGWDCPGTGYAAGGMPLAVYHRRTFLLSIASWRTRYVFAWGIVVQFQIQ